MDGKSVRTIGAMGLLSIMGMLVLFLFSLSSVTDTGALEVGKRLRHSLKRSLDQSIGNEAAKVSMRRVGKGVEAERHYVIRLRPSPGVSTSPKAVATVMERAVKIVNGTVQKSRSRLVIRCEATLADGSVLSRHFERGAGSTRSARTGRSLRCASRSPRRPASVSTAARTTRRTRRDRSRAYACAH